MILMTRDDIRAVVHTALLSLGLIKKDDEITEETKFVEGLQMDSLDCLELVMNVETRFGISLKDDAMERAQTVGLFIDEIVVQLRAPEKA